MDFNSFYFLIIALLKVLDKLSISDTINVSHPESGVETDLKNILDLFKSVIINGCPEADVPVLDPYQFQIYRDNVSGDILSYSIMINDGVITGFSDFEILGFNFDKANLSIRLKLNFPMLLLYSEKYEFEGNLFQILPLSGQGILNFQVHNLTISSNVFLTQSLDGRSLLIDRFEEAKFAIAYISGSTDIDGNIDVIFNTLVKDLLANYITRFNRYISAKYRIGIAKAMNELLNKLDSWHLIEKYLHRNK